MAIAQIRAHVPDVVCMLWPAQCLLRTFRYDCGSAGTDPDHRRRHHHRAVVRLPVRRSHRAGSDIPEHDHTDGNYRRLRIVTVALEAFRYAYAGDCARHEPGSTLPADARHRGEIHCRRSGGAWRRHRDRFARTTHQGDDGHHHTGVRGHDPARRQSESRS